jgi:hypothetical protein
MDPHTGRSLGEHLSADNTISDLLNHPAFAGFDGTVRLWETGGGTHVRTLRSERRYERMDITGLTGITDAQRAALLALGAVEKQSAAAAASIGS